MVFSSITFVYAFFPLVAVAYYLSKNRVYRNVVLLLASLLFYSWGEPRFLLLMLAATLAAYCGGLLMERSTAHKRLILIVTVVLLVGNLFVFKYLNFFSENLSALFGWRVLPKLTLPIGISFYTFQILSYVIDLYRGEIRVQRNYFYLLLYVSFFPQLIAGPIVRYETVEQEILERRESIFWRTLTTPIPPFPSRISGGGGTSPCRHGSATMSTSRSAATASKNPAGSGTFWSSGR